MANLQPALQGPDQGRANAAAAAAQHIVAEAIAAGPQGLPQEVLGQNPGVGNVPAGGAAAAAQVGGAMGLPAFQAPARHYTFASLFTDASANPNYADAFRVVIPSILTRLHH